MIFIASEGFSIPTRRPVVVVGFVILCFIVPVVCVRAIAWVVAGFTKK